MLADTVDPHQWRSVRLLLAEGEQLTPDVYSRFVTAFPTALYNTYGLTEVSTVAVWTPTDRQPVNMIPIGHAAGLSVAIVDEDLRPVQDGRPGELIVGGPGIAAGYHNQPALTAERFVPDPMTGDVFFRTGDRGIQAPRRSPSDYGPTRRPAQDPGVSGQATAKSRPSSSSTRPSREPSSSDEPRVTSSSSSHTSNVPACHQHSEI